MHPLLLILLCLTPYILLGAWAIRNKREDDELMEARKHPKSEWRQMTQAERDELDDFLTPLKFPEAIKLDEHEKALAWDNINFAFGIKKKTVGYTM